MDNKTVTEIETLASQLSQQELDDVLMFVKMRGFASKGKCNHPSSNEWLVFQPWEKRLHYTRVLFWAGFEALKGKCFLWERKTT